jgi:ring-1,2-phenylacetyl-CoA epoxidase subunit PaaE
MEEWILTLLPPVDHPPQTAAPGQTSRPVFYLCGPPAFMRMAQFTLRLLGFSDAQIKKENFTVEYVPPPPLLTDTTPKRVTILRNDSPLHFEAAWPDTILHAAERHHISLPYSCRGGRCSTCVAKCLSGKVKMSINEVLTEKDLQDGLVLTCVGYAETDITLSFRQ